MYNEWLKITKIDLSKDVSDKGFISTYKRNLKTQKQVRKQSHGKLTFFFISHYSNEK
jgi:hypothetical protein